MSDDNVSLAVRDTLMRRETSPDGEVVDAVAWIACHGVSGSPGCYIEEYTIKVRRKVIRRRPADVADD